MANTGIETMVEDTPVQQDKGSPTQALDANLNRAQRWRFRQQSKGRGRGEGAHESDWPPSYPLPPEWVGSEINGVSFQEGDPQEGRDGCYEPPSDLGSVCEKVHPLKKVSLSAEIAAEISGANKKIQEKAILSARNSHPWVPKAPNSSESAADKKKWGKCRKWG